MELETERLRLRPLCREDAAAVVRYRNDPAVSRFQGWTPPDEAAVWQFVEEQEKRLPLALGQWFQLAFLQRSDGATVGDMGLHRHTAQEIELGITVAPEHQRRGLAREALRAVIAHLFATGAAEILRAEIDPDNEASRALFADLGFLPAPRGSTGEPGPMLRVFRRKHADSRQT